MEAVRRLTQDLDLPDSGTFRDKSDETVFVGPSRLVGQGIARPIHFILGIACRVIGGIENPYCNPLLLDIIVDGVSIESRMKSQKAKGAHPKR
jgi:hypothetical protein